MVSPAPNCPVSRCIRCRLFVHLCICAAAPKLAALRTRVVLVLHSKELKRSSNTGLLLKLSAELDVHVHGRIGERSDARQWIDEACYRPVVLYPSPTAIPLSRELALKDPRPLALIVPDGTWGQARHMVKRIEGLSSWPRVTLPQAPEAMLRPRRQVTAERMSTYEALAQALGVLEDDRDQERRMQDFYRLAASRMLAMRGIFTSG